MNTDDSPILANRHGFRNIETKPGVLMNTMTADRFEQFFEDIDQHPKDIILDKSAMVVMVSHDGLLFLPEEIGAIAAIVHCHKVSTMTPSELMTSWIKLLHFFKSGLPVDRLLKWL